MDEEKTTQEQENETEPEVKEEEKQKPAETTEKQDHVSSAKEAEKPAETKAEKTFSQEEVNRIVKDRVARAAKDGQAIAAENAALKNSLACFKAGVRAECIEDAVTLAAKLTDDKTDFDTALAKILEKYPDFGRTPQVKNTSVDMQAKKNDQSLSALRGAMGLSAKK